MNDVEYFNTKDKTPERIKCLVACIPIITFVNL